MRLRRACRRSRGTSAVEMVLVAPLLIALIMGQLESSRLGMVAQMLTTAAREGCRVAVISGISLSVPYSRVSWLPTPHHLKSAMVTAPVIMNRE